MALHLALGLCLCLLFTQCAEGNIDDFDCVEIYKQPAFQHPLLKNHKIQETFSLDGKLTRINKYGTKQHCPKGTVPILRQRNSSEIVHLDTAEQFGQHFATIETVLDGSIYRGAEADISIHDLKLQNNQFSKSQIWLENGPLNQVNSIQAGWAVHPRLYGDSLTRLTIYWTGNGYRTGCYNTQCPGFVVVSRNPRLGNRFWGTSVYGSTSLSFNLRIFQDGFSGNWALKMNNELIGYWPKELFTHLKEGASLVRFGGNTFISPDGMSPPMGNGHFPVSDFKKTANFKNVLVRNSKYKRVYVEDRYVRRYADNYSCFRVLYWGYSRSSGVSLSFGGPGGVWCIVMNSEMEIDNFSEIVEDVGSPLMAEALAIKIGLQRVLSIDISSIEVRSDSQILMNAFAKGKSISELYGVQTDLAILLPSFSVIYFSYVPRLTNAKAEALAKSKVRDVSQNLMA